MNRLFAWKWISMCALTLGVAAVAPADVITYDTYIDSYAGTPSPFIPGNQDVNYGGNAALKVVVSPGSTDYPNATSTTRTLVKLPDSFWTSLGNQNVDSAVMSFRVRNLNSNRPFTRTVSAHPMLHVFVEGTGGVATNTMGGTQNTLANPIGADWLTYDGVNAWNAPGAGNSTADYDAAHSAVGVVSIGGGVTKMSWDLKAMINDPIARDNIETYGLMIKITDDTIFPEVGASQQFISFYSYEFAMAQGTPADWFPVASFTVPEPAAIGIIGIALLTLGIRRKARH